MDFITFFTEGTTGDTPELFSYVNVALFNEPDFKNADGQISIEDILDAPAIYRAYPWIPRRVFVEVVRSNHRVLQGEGLRIQTLGGGEGTIFIASDYYDDILNYPGDQPSEGRDFLAKALVHELGHAVDDHDDNSEQFPGPEEIQRQEKFANDFMNKWYR